MWGERVLFHSLSLIRINFIGQAISLWVPEKWLTFPVSRMNDLGETSD